jgi:hypothetical protein
MPLPGVSTRALHNAFVIEKGIDRRLIRPHR